MSPPDFSDVFVNLDVNSIEGFLAEPKDGVEVLLAPGNICKCEKVRAWWFSRGPIFSPDLGGDWTC